MKALVLVVVFGQALAQAGSLKFQGKRYAYEVSEPGTKGPHPAIVVLHGAGGEGAPMIELWRRLASEQGVVLIAPDWPRVTEFEDVAADVFAGMVAAETKRRNIDTRRVFVFGYSAGGYLALDAGLQRSDVFAAIAVLANRLDPAYASLLDRPSRKVPVALYIGDRDQYFSLEKVRATRDLLLGKGFPVHYVELPGRDHNYPAVSEQVNADAWRFFQGAALP